MPESATIQANALPLTYADLVNQFATCGLAAGQTVLVHSSLSRLGWVVGGAVDVLRALLTVLGSTGTLMMPTHTGDNSDPATWCNPPVPEPSWPITRQNRPAYDPARTPTRGMGVIPELFRTWPGVLRSAHPFVSFAAYGPQAAYLTADHLNLELPLGEDSPLGKLYA